MLNSQCPCCPKGKLELVYHDMIPVNYIYKITKKGRLSKLPKITESPSMGGYDLNIRCSNNECSFFVIESEIPAEHEEQLKLIFESYHERV